MRHHDSRRGCFASHGTLTIQFGSWRPIEAFAIRITPPCYSTTTSVYFLILNTEASVVFVVFVVRESTFVATSVRQIEIEEKSQCRTERKIAGNK